jgi:hypothetical protein
MILIYISATIEVQLEKPTFSFRLGGEWMV